MKSAKKIITLLITFMIISSFTMTYAKTAISEAESSLLFTIEDSPVVSHENITKIQK